MTAEERETVRTNAMNMSHGMLLTLITTYIKAGLHAPLAADDLEVKQILSNVAIARGLMR